MSRSYRELCDRAVVNFEFWTGDIQNKGTAALGAMSVSGTPVMKKIGRTVGVTKTVAADGITSGAVASALDVTGTVTFEGVFRYDSFPPIILRQIGATGGWGFGSFTGTDRGEIYLLDAVGAGARLVMTATSVIQKSSTMPPHLVMTSIAGGTSGSVWIDGVPSAPVYALAGVAANPPASVVTCLLVASQQGTVVLSRAWQGALDAAEVATLYNAYSTLTVPSKV